MFSKKVTDGRVMLAVLHSMILVSNIFVSALLLSLPDCLVPSFQDLDRRSTGTSPFWRQVVCLVFERPGQRSEKTWKCSVIWRIHESNSSVLVFDQAKSLDALSLCFEYANAELTLVAPSWRLHLREVAKMVAYLVQVVNGFQAGTAQERERSGGLDW